MGAHGVRVAGREPGPRPPLPLRHELRLLLQLPPSPRHRCEPKAPLPGPRPPWHRRRGHSPSHDGRRPAPRWRHCSSAQGIVGGWYAWDAFPLGKLGPSVTLDGRPRARGPRRPESRAPGLCRPLQAWLLPREPWRAVGAGLGGCKSQATPTWPAAFLSLLPGFASVRCSSVAAPWQTPGRVPCEAFCCRATPVRSPDLSYPFGFPTRPAPVAP